MATELAKAYVQIIPSAKGIGSSIEQEINGADIGTRSGNLFSGAFKKMILAAGIGKVVSKVIGDAFSQGGELQQNLGGTAAVFGDFANTIKTQATTAYRDMGMSASDYMATANKMGSLFQGSGIEQQKALDMTSQAMQRAADTASVMGIDMSMAMESVAGMAKGNFTMMDNLGVAMNATTLEAYALEKGINFEWKTASNAEKAQLAMQMFMERTSQYAGNFARESEDTWTGSIGSMKASYQNLMADIMLGNDLSGSLTALGGTIVTFVGNNLIPAVVNISKGLPQALVSLIAEFTPTLISASGQVVSQVLSWIQTQFPLFLAKGTETVNNIVNGILKGLPSVLLSAGKLLTVFLATIIDAFPSVLKSGADLLLNLVNGIINNLPAITKSALKAIAQFLVGIGQKMPEILQKGIEILGKLAAGLIQAIPNLVSKIPQIVQAIKDSFSSVDWWSIGLNIISGIANGLANAGHMLWDAVKGILGNFKDKVLSFFGIHSPSRWGMYVGKMISLGFPKGVEENLNPFRVAMDSLGQTASEPLDAVASARMSLAEKDTQKDSKVLEKLDKLIEILWKILDKDGGDDDPTSREAIRLLRELGVVFE